MNQKYNFIKYILCVVFSISFCISCYDDKGNYDYNDINEIEIEGIEEEYSLRMEELLTIKPILKSSIQGNEANYKYQWIFLSIQIDKKLYYNYTFSNDKYLEDVWLQLPGGSYTAYYKITDTSTGIEWVSKNFKISISDEIASGILVLSDVNDKARVDFISYFNNELTLKLDVLSIINSEYPDFGKPLSLSCYSDNNSPKMGATVEDGRYAVTILTNTGAYRLHPGNFTYDPLYNLNYVFIGNPSDDFIAMRIAEGGYLIDNSNNVYLYNYTYSTYWTVGIYVNTTVDSKYINVSPMIGAVTPTSSYGGIVMYDTDNKSFIYQRGSFIKYSSYFSTSLEQTFNELEFKMNNTGKDLLYLFCRETEASVSMPKIYCILKDPVTEELFIGSFEFGNTIKQTMYAKIPLVDSENIREFAMGQNISKTGNLNPFLYYRTDNKVYVYNINDGDNKVVYTAPDNNIITTMKFLGNSRNVSSSSEWLEDLMIATYDPAKPANSCGKLEVMKVTPLYGDLNINEYNEEKMEWTGFGKIVDIEWKSRSNQ
ncbi:hypothetical protein GGR21_001549 [Dysgonomonas hofstadii]|uniref:PKD-like family protein n=1 Tax=Dysgonomonas hofstadii TaxID=637886 RepID=A0A840CPY6_9BACT|nr:PKD-like family lipoprotein [Dysgonomonas hofstadii]MBB4035654.1 hypothetical protein [Dysgonomonas hofstadii]